MAKILVVDSNDGARSSVCIALRTAGHECEGIASGARAIEALRGQKLDLVMTDIRLDDLGGLDLLRAVKRESPTTGVVIMASVGSVETAVEAVQLGALNYLRKPLASGDLVSAVEKALDRLGPTFAPSSEGIECEDISTATGIIGKSKPILDLLDLVEQVSTTDSSILVTGETGTGKELVGRAIHKLSGRSEKVFCAVNSAAFPESLLESELFGHRRGAFTGATANKKGLFEFAHKGTVFLDEVAEMPLSMQVKLLRFLQTGEIRAVGDETTRFVDVRLVAATNKNLEDHVASGTFREDLFYRLAVIPVHMPPLRERREDIELLAKHFLRRFATRGGKEVDGIDESAMDLLSGYSWPGNVRQLENSIERGVALCRSRKIQVEDLPVRMRESSTVRDGDSIDSLQAMERNHILSTLDKVGWNRKHAAELLQISTTTLWRRLKEFGVETDGGRRPIGPAQSPRS